MKGLIVLLLGLLAPSSFAQKTLATWRCTPAGAAEGRVRLLSGSDGVVAWVEKGGSRCATTEGSSSYLYFDIDPFVRRSGPVYVAVEYFDEAAGGALTAQYDAGGTIEQAYTAAEDGAGGLALGRGEWKTCELELRRPDFQGRENLGACFRLTGMPLFIRGVSLYSVKPDDWDSLKERAPMEVKPIVHIGSGGELIVGGFDPSRKEDVPGQIRALEANMPGFKQLGFTSHEVYIRWNLCEVAPGVYDWSVYDPYVALYKKYGVKWVPFIICGSPYSLPDWYFNGPERQGYVCLEHNQESHVQSLWNPAMRAHVKSFLKAFADHYRDSGVIEAMLLGVTGNYGEAIYIASGNDWTNSVHGEYHTHAGYWAGDKYAVASFRSAIKAKYRTIARLNKAWGKSLASFDDVKPFIPRGNEWNNRAKLDFIHWYTDSMTDYSRFWLKETRADLPRAGIYLCTGGHAPAEHGADFGEQCKIAAAVHGGVRITNEASDYNLNFALTRWVASAARQYGAYFSFEPAGGVDANGVVARIYNATASGAKGLHYYFPNIFGSAAAREAFVKNGDAFQQRKPITEVGLYYPETDIQVTGQLFFEKVMPLRNKFDLIYLSDGQIADGSLKQVKALVMLAGTIAEQSSWKRIADWVKRGGLLLYATGIGQPVTVEGAPAEIAPLLAPGAHTGKGRVAVFNGKPNAAEYRAFLQATLSAAPELSPAARRAVAAGTDGVFATLFAPGTILWYNATDQPVERTGPDGAKLQVPAHAVR